MRWPTSKTWEQKSTSSCWLVMVMTVRLNRASRVSYVVYRCGRPQFPHSPCTLQRSTIWTCTRICSHDLNAWCRTRGRSTWPRSRPWLWKTCYTPVLLYPENLKYRCRNGINQGHYFPFSQIFPLWVKRPFTYSEQDFFSLEKYYMVTIVFSMGQLGIFKSGFMMIKHIFLA